jgi:hypothetical protein
MPDLFLAGDRHVGCPVHGLVNTSDRFIRLKAPSAGEGRGPASHRRPRGGKLAVLGVDCVGIAHRESRWQERRLADVKFVAVWQLGRHHQPQCLVAKICTLRLARSRRDMRL